MLTPSQVTRSLLLFVAAIVVAGVFVGHVVAAAGIALFVFLLAVIEGKPSWRRAFDPDRKREAGIFDGGRLTHPVRTIAGTRHPRRTQQCPENRPLLGRYVPRG